LLGSVLAEPGGVEEQATGLGGGGKSG